MRPDQIDLMDLDPFVRATDGDLFRVLRDEDPCHWNDEPDGGEGFWSLTLSNEQHFFAPNGSKRSSLGTKNRG